MMPQYHHNRGVGVWQNFVYMETDDAHLLALDARSGNLLWDVAYADKAKQYGATSAPLVVKDEVIVGTSGGDSGVRGFLAAYRRTDWEAEVAFLDNSRARRVRLRQLARRFVSAWRWHDLDARHLRSQTQHSLLDNRQRRTRFCGRFPPRRRPLYSLRFGAQPRHRRVEMVFPVHASRRVRL